MRYGEISKIRDMILEAAGEKSVFTVLGVKRGIGKLPVFRTRFRFRADKTFGYLRGEFVERLRSAGKGGAKDGCR